MNRRHYLAAVGGGFIGHFSGCVGAGGPLGGAGRPPDPTTSEPSGAVTGADGSPSTICERDPRPNRIPAIVDPAFAPDWNGVSGPPRLTDSTTVVGIRRGDDARAYPVSVLRHEIVNDSFDVPILVTFCPICSSGLTAERTVDGRETVFGNTGHTWKPPNAPGREAIESDRVFGISYSGGGKQPAPSNDPNLVMFDRLTGSFWSQLLARAICGPRSGEQLTLVPSTVTDWGTWRDTHPDTTVLLPSPHSKLWGDGSG